MNKFNINHILISRSLNISIEYIPKHIKFIKPISFNRIKNVRVCPIFRIKEFINPNGIVFIHTDFHSQLIKNSFFAFCRTKNNIIFEIKKKESFTNNEMKKIYRLKFFILKP